MNDNILTSKQHHTYRYCVKSICDSNAINIKGLSGDNAITYLDTSNITDNTIGSLQEMLLKDAPSRAQRLVIPNTIVYSMVRPNLRHYGFLSNPPSNMVVSTGFLTLNIKKEFKNKIDIRYLYLLLTQPHIVNYLQGVAQNAVSAYPSLNPSDIESLSFDFPDFWIQKLIADFYFNIDNKIAINREINRNFTISMP